MLIVSLSYAIQNGFLVPDENMRRTIEGHESLAVECLRAWKIADGTTVSVNARISHKLINGTAYKTYTGADIVTYRTGLNLHRLASHKVARNTSAWDRTTIKVISRPGRSQALVILEPPAGDHPQLVIVSISKSAKDIKTLATLDAELMSVQVQGHSALVNAKEFIYSASNTWSTRRVRLRFGF